VLWYDKAHSCAIQVKAKIIRVNEQDSLDDTRTKKVVIQNNVTRLNDPIFVFILLMGNIFKENIENKEHYADKTSYVKACIRWSS